MTNKVLLRSRASQPQADFVNASEPFPAFVGGFGSGKTEAGIMRALRLKYQYPEQDVAYYLPTYDLVRMIGYPRFTAILKAARVSYKLNKSEHVLTIRDKGSLIFRTLDTPERIIGYEVADSVVDELDTLKPELAAHCWNQIIARNRQKKPDGSENTIGVATTPEGFRFVYERWEKEALPGYRLIRASTYSNARNLPAKYIETLIQSYPAQLISAYIEGLFVNLTSGAVYPDFDRTLNNTEATLNAGEPLHVGMDFNVRNMTAILGVEREGCPIVVGELTQVRDTPAMAQLLVERYKQKGHHVTVYPDASGQNTSSKNAGESDLLILQNAGLTIRAPSTNPAVRDRVNAVNGQIHAGGKRKLLINTRLAPVTTECLEQQVYDKNGDPDKDAGKDHAPDGLGYWIHYRWPIVRPATPRKHVNHMNR